MSWFARSIANSLKLDDDDDNDDNLKRENEHHDPSSSQSSPSSQGRGGVKEDISELTKTLTRQLWGVASFLAPPPQSEPKVSDSDPELPDTTGISGIRSDFAEIGGKFRSGISKLASNSTVSEFTKIASNLLQLGSEEEDYDSMIAGVTEEVVAFVRDIASHPETWMDFPLPDDEDDDEFDMSDAQQEHALAVERLAPRLAALRIELCPGYMSEDSFWKIYFVLLHPRLNRLDAELLSTPQIVKARALMTQELQNRTKSKPQQDWSEGGALYSRDITNLQREESPSVPSIAQSDSDPLETDKHPILSNEIQVIDKAVVEEGPRNGVNYQNVHSGSSSRVMDDKYEDDGDDWLKEEENSELGGDGGTTIPIEAEEDVSFSDLEDDDEDVRTSYKKGTYGSDSSTKDSRDWVQLGRSSTDSSKDINTVIIDRVGSEQVSAHDSEIKESNDWLNLDDIDVV